MSATPFFNMEGSEPKMTNDEPRLAPDALAQLNFPEVATVLPRISLPVHRTAADTEIQELYSANGAVFR